MSEKDFNSRPHITPDVASERRDATQSIRQAMECVSINSFEIEGRTVEIPVVKWHPIDRTNHEYEKKLALVLERNKGMSISPATVVNFLPIPLYSDSTLAPLKFPGCVVPAAHSCEFTTKTFTEVFIEPALLNGTLVPTEHSPVTLAQEFVRLNPLGVCVLPCAASQIDAFLASDQEYRQAFDRARQEATAWLWEKVNYTQCHIDELGPYEDRTGIAAAHRLLHLKLISNLPQWAKNRTKRKVGE